MTHVGDDLDPDETRYSVRMSENEIRALAAGELPATVREYAEECVVFLDGKIGEGLARQRARAERRANG